MVGETRVKEELLAIATTGRSVSGALMENGHASLVHAAHTFFGGLKNARTAAGVKAARVSNKPKGWTRARVVREIKSRRAQDKSLGGSKVPQALYRAARKHFGNWAGAIVAAGIDPATIVVRNTKYTKPFIIRKLRGLAREGSDLRSVKIARKVDLKAIRREFGTLAAAVRAAGLEHITATRVHALKKWNRERALNVLRERAARGIHTLTPGLHRVAQLYFGGAERARVAAGVPSPIDVRIEARRRRTKAPRRDPKKSKRTPGRGSRSRNN